MQQVYLGLGSNIDADRNIHAGIAALEELFGEVEHSGVYRSAAIGFNGAPFLNLVAGVKTGLTLNELAFTLRALEYRYGRLIDSPKFTSRQLDIDILTFGDCLGTHHGIMLPRPEVLVNAFVLRPFAELAPRLVLPGQRWALATLWQRYADPRQSAERIGGVDKQHPAFRRSYRSTASKEENGADSLKSDFVQ